MSQKPISPPPIPPSPDPGVIGGSSSTVRRHHTISSSSRRTSSKIPNNLEADEWNEHDIVGEDWTGGVGTIGGERAASGLHRAGSLPSKYARMIRTPASNRTGALTPSKTAPSLSTYDAGGEEDDWEKDVRRLTEAENAEYQQAHNHQEYPADEDGSDQGSNEYGSPPAGANVRRHQSMTYGNASKRSIGGLQRSGTVSGKVRSRTMNSTTEAPDAEENFEPQYSQQDPAEYDDPGSWHGHSQVGSDSQQSYNSNPNTTNSWGSSSGHDSNTWRANAPGDWRAPGGVIGAVGQMDDLSRSMANLDIHGQPSHGPSYPQGGPRFNPNARQPSPNIHPQYIENQQGGRRLQLYTEIPSSTGNVGPVSASAYVPPIGHGHGTPGPPLVTRNGKERSLSARTSNSNLAQNYNNGQFNNMPPPPPLPSQYQNNNGGYAGRLGNNLGNNAPNGGYGQSHPGQVNPQAQFQAQNPATYLQSPIDIPTLIAEKGYNPATFDTKPPFARYFVIKSYTEDDVHKSLKYEIWSSTDPGNKRLDKAFKECAGRGPIYLFFSVNASGHFCGMAEMLTPVDYTRSSTVWASDKWKGVFKVRWIFVRDIPNAILRNIRLNNTPERKPVTNSRDTQELLPEAGHEMLKMFFTHPARTSLLQDFAFYELQSIQKHQAQGPGQGQGQGQSPQSGVTSPQPSYQHVNDPNALPPQHPYAMPNPHTIQHQQSGQLGPGGLAAQQMMMPPMMNPNAGVIGQGYGGGPNPQVVQGVMRGTSPAPHPGAGGYGGGY